MWPETLDCTVYRARAAAENVPWSAIGDEGGELAEIHLEKTICEYRRVLA